MVGIVLQFNWHKNVVATPNRTHMPPAPNDFSPKINSFLRNSLEFSSFYCRSLFTFARLACNVSCEYSRCPQFDAHFGIPSILVYTLNVWTQEALTIGVRISQIVFICARCAANTIKTVCSFLSRNINTSGSLFLLPVPRS